MTRRELISVTLSSSSEEDDEDDEEEEKPVETHAETVAIPEMCEGETSAACSFDKSAIAELKTSSSTTPSTDQVFLLWKCFCGQQRGLTRYSHLAEIVDLFRLCIAKFIVF